MKAEPKRERKDSSSFLARTQPVKPQTLYLLELSELPLSLYKVCSFPCPVGTRTCLATLQNLNYNSLLILHKPPIAGEISVYLFQVSTLVTRLGTREDPWGPWDWWADLKPLSLIAFLTNPGVQTYAFLLDLSLQPVCVWSSPGVIWGLFKGFDFRVKTLFCVLVLVWHFHLILRSDCFNW